MNMFILKIKMKFMIFKVITALFKFKNLCL